MNSAKQQKPVFPGLQWCWLKLEQMEPVLLYDMLALREAIFVVEQKCIYQELDGLDKSAEHLLALQNGEVIACIRLLPPAGEEDQIRIGRVAVSSDWRKKGVARLMMQKAIEKARRDYPSSGVCLHAQTYLQGFYVSLGFQLNGDEFLEDGIPHVLMQLNQPNQSE
jgi:ElaA protein